MRKPILLCAVISFLVMWTSYAWGAPAANFTASPTVWSAPSSVAFTDKSTGNITSWLWDFGDGTQSNANNPVHQYDDSGTYTITLTVSALDGTDTQIKNDYVVVEKYIPPGDEYLMHMDSSALQKFGLYYPVTYKFKLPSGATNLAAQYRYWEGTWHTLPVKNSTDIFNGIDAVRFDYAGGFAYVSVNFSRASDNIYIRIVDATGQPVSVDFDSIPKYYDERKTAVTFTLDQWASWSDVEFRAASDYLGLNGLYFSVGIITNGAPWSSIQQKIDKYGDQLEIASQSTYLSQNAAEYEANGYQTEVIGSRDAIRNNLTFNSHPYVPVYIEPWGYYDAIIDSLLTSGDYLLSRGRLWSPIESTFAPWNPTNERYGRVGYTFSDANNFDDVNLLYQTNAAFDDVLAAGGIYHLVDHPAQGLWHDGSYLLQHLNHVNGRNDVWYTPLGPLYQYHFVQEMRGNLSIQHLGTPNLTASFFATPLSGNSPLSVSFTDNSSGVITSWQWEFGDSATSSQQNPTHVYAAAGSYDVKLTVIGPGGAVSSLRSNYIVVSPPSVNITAPVTGVVFATPATIPIIATATTNTGVTVSRVDFYAGTTLVGSATSSPYSFIWRNVAAGSYSLTAQVTDSLGAIATSLPVGITVVGNTLPPPWETRDIGNVGLLGSSGYLGGTFSISGSGSDIWGTADSFRYMYQSLTGDGQIIARVASQQNTSDWAKAGVMIRETLLSNSSCALMSVTPGNGSAFQRRLATAGNSSNTFGPVLTAPYWVKLARSGNTFSGYISSNGVNWVLVGSDTINMADTVYVGLAVTAHNNTTLCTANMDAVAVTAGTPAISPTVSITAPADGASFAAPAAISITATATAGSGATVSRVDFYAGTTLVGSATTSPYSFTWSSVAAGSYSLTARVTDSLNGTATSSAVGITVTGSALPSSWGTRDIGNVGLAGSAGYQNSTFSLSGSGADIWYAADGFRFVYQPLTGDGQIIARVASQQNTNIWAKSGVMIRETLASNSSNALMALAPGIGATFQRRLTTAGASVNTTGPGVTAPYWVKLVRSGNTFSGYVSSNGVSWTLVGSDTINMASSVYVGLAVTSHNNTVLCTTTMDGVSVAGGTPVNPPTVSITAPSDGAAFPAPATIAIAATATAGTGATVSRVDFYAGTTLVGSATTSPYSFTWSSVAAGSYSLTALVTDSLNETATSSPVGITVAAIPVNPPTVSITTPTDGAAFSAPAAITITATATAGTGATVSRVDFYGGTTLVGSATTSPYSFTWSNVAAGSYSLTARVTDSLNGTATSNAVGITVAGSALPSSWGTLDIGNVGLAGSVGYQNSTFSLSGSGADIWNTADAFRFVYQPLTGDGQIVARVTALQNTNIWAKSGVMIRETLASNSSHALMALAPGIGATFQRRLTTGGSSLNTTGPSVTAPYWVKLVRSGNTFSGYVSSNGVSWTLVGSDTINMASSVYVGLAVTSHNNTVLCTTTMDGVSVTTGTPVNPPTVSITMPTDGTSFAAPATIAIAATATAGTGATVSRVDFYAGTTLVGSATTSPYSFTWSSVAAGSYSLTALVTDSLNETATSSPVGITVAAIPVNPPTVSITTPTDGAAFPAPAAITITATATAGTGATVSRVDFYVGTTLVGSATTSPYSFTWSNVAAGSYSLTARVTDSLNGTATSSPVGITVAGSALPSSWGTLDIGNVGLAGSAGYQNSTFSLSGSGADIWNTADAFRFVYQPLTGDGQIIARVTALQNTNIWAKGGVMIRETLASNSSHALMALAPGIGATFQRRLTVGGSSVNTTGQWVTVPYWVKLVRSGNTFSGYVSSNGVSWTLVGSDTINMASSVYVGLAVTSHNNAALCTVTMDGVQ